jgi:hypothetical protein
VLHSLSHHLVPHPFCAMTADTISVVPMTPQSFPIALPPSPTINSHANPTRPATRRVRSQSASGSIAPRPPRPQLFHAKRSTSPFLYRIRDNAGAALNTPRPLNRQNSHSAGITIASPDAQGQDGLLKWDVLVWNEHVAQHRPKRPRLHSTHGFESSIIDDHATDDPRSSLATQDSRAELTAMYFPNSFANSQNTPSSSVCPIASRVFSAASAITDVLTPTFSPPTRQFPPLGCQSYQEHSM